MYRSADRKSQKLSPLFKCRKIFRMYEYPLRGTHIILKAVTVKWFDILLKMGQSLFFQKGIRVHESKQEAVSLLKIAENLPSITSLLKDICNKLFLPHECRMY